MGPVWHVGPGLPEPTIIPSQSALWDPKLPGPRGHLQEWALLPVRHLGSWLHHVSGSWGAPGLGKRGRRARVGPGMQVEACTDR